MWASGPGAYGAPAHGQTGLRSNYERLQQGGDPQRYAMPDGSAPRRATQSFTSRYYDAQHTDELFPKPGAGQGRRLPDDEGSFRSVALQSESSFHSSRPAGFEHESLEGAPASDYLQYCADKAARLALWAGAAALECVAAYALVVTVSAACSVEFGLVSKLAWESWCGSFMSMMVGFASLAVLALLLGVAAFVIGLKESKVLVRVLYTSSGLLGFVVFVVLLISLAAAVQSRPSVIRLANLLCQETDLWGCGAEPAAPRALGAGGNATRLRRRLSLAEAAIGFEQDYSQEHDASGTSEVCRTLAQLCAPAPGFDARTACVCDGQWDFAPQGARRLGPRPSGAAAALRRWAGRRLMNDPWQGSIGSYCDAWLDSVPGEWCFVSPAQACGAGDQRGYTTSHGAAWVRSAAPCGDAVESRSQIVLQGMDMMSSALQLVALLGFSLLSVAVCGVLLSRHPSKATQWTPVDPRGLGYSPPPGQSLEQMFEDAQREAMRRLTDATPEHMKFTLFGYYKQAQEGDFVPERSAGWSEKERLKYGYWARHRGMPRAQAIEGYVQTVRQLD